MSKLIDRKGEVYENSNKEKIVIIEYTNYRNVSFMFEDGTIIKNREYSDLKRGKFKNPNKPSIYGVGFIGQGEYPSSINNKVLKSYICWKSMLSRVYYGKELSYKDCTVIEEWHNFQNFAKWFYENYNPEVMEDWQLDKDILQKGNKIYSPETCCFVPQELNMLFVKRVRNRGDLPIGVFIHKGKICSQISNSSGRKFLGYYTTPEEAFQAYKTAKEAHIKEVADKWKPLIKPEVYEAMYTYEVEITD